MSAQHNVLFVKRGRLPGSPCYVTKKDLGHGEFLKHCDNGDHSIYVRKTCWKNIPHVMMNEKQYHATALYPREDIFFYGDTSFPNIKKPNYFFW